MSKRPKITVRAMQPSDRAEVAELICVSTNYWFQMNGNPAVFPDGPNSTSIYFDVYETIDAGENLVAVNEDNGCLAGSVFLHPRETHISLGIMNVHPNYFGCGVASSMLREATKRADEAGKPMRLVSSGRNTDSFSLYNRVGFVPRVLFQGMWLTVPETGLDATADGQEFVREATLDDVDAMVAVEFEVAGIKRPNDIRYFIENVHECWHVSVYEDAAGAIQGFAVSCEHPGCRMVGPCASRTEAQAAALMLTELQLRKGLTMAYMLPVACEELVKTSYSWGAKNYEVALGQVRGEYQPMNGVSVPTFLPETG
ncbi:MAG: GNAT family N-acetyltransferase [Phycisphaerales bacterium]|nr:GNAT family N-acetyltransferase [Phycisphaerales bacterium]